MFCYLKKIICNYFFMYYYYKLLSRFDYIFGWSEVGLKRKRGRAKSIHFLGPALRPAQYETFDELRPLITCKFIESNYIKHVYFYILNRNL